MKTKLMTMTFGICCSLLLSGCSSEGESVVQKESSHEGHPAHTVSGDLQEETGSKDIAPDFLSEKPEEMKTIYLAVAQNKDLLEKIPCYCGCGNQRTIKTITIVLSMRIRKMGKWFGMTTGQDVEFA